MEVVMSKKLAGKKVVITGGTSGIGLATARAAIDEGADVIVTGSSAESVAAATKELGPRAHVIRSDASSLDAIASLAKEVESRFGRVDLLFLNAGIAPFAPSDAVNEESFDRLFDVNVKGPFFTVQKLRPLLAPGASVVFNTSVVQKMGFAGTSVYSATKAALGSLVRTLAIELAPQKIRVNGVAPGPVETPILGKTGMPKQAIDDFETRLTARSPVGRLGRPEEIAAAVLFLATPEAGFIVGEDIVIDGGLTLV
jgi:NAD(P)-dependent dehydrogenase (short-subunit alcohol dehydrogenase family)